MAAAAGDDLPLVRVGGVPEHFNLPWLQAQEAGLFASHGVRFEWREYPLGTGAMLQALKQGDVDVIVALTEGIVGDIAQGSDLRLIGTYVQSPLTWAISTGPTSRVHEVADLKNQRIGVSRLNSGSHLMSCVLASQRGWRQTDLNYVVEGSFENLRKSLVDNRTEAFMWETFTTKPYHDSGEIRRIGEIVTPWSCFLMASRTGILNAKRDAIRRLITAINESASKFKAAGAAIVPEIARRYGLREEDAKAWYEAVDIAAKPVISESTLNTAIHALKDAGILTSQNYPTEKKLSEFVDRSVTLEADIKSMRLYAKPELLTALWNNIRLRIKKERGPLTYQELLPYDQNHYGGVSTLDICAKACALTKDSRVIQLGSSLGGPSRYLSGAYGCEVLAVELQEDLHGAASELTHRCGLDQQVHHMGGNFLSIARHLAQNSYDAITSWLTVLHFDRTERARLFSESLRVLKPGGVFYAEDFFERAPFSPEEQQILRHDVYCKYLPSLETYTAELKSAGFEVVEMQDLTNDWQRMTAARSEAFKSARAEHVEVHGEEVVQGLEFFFSQVTTLFAGGHCGGVRVVARKPMA